MYLTSSPKLGLQSSTLRLLDSEVIHFMSGARDRICPSLHPMGSGRGVGLGWGVAWVSGALILRKAAFTEPPGMVRD